MMKKIILNPEDFTIYACSGEKPGCFAIYPEEIKKMEEIRNKFINAPIPDGYIIKAFRFGKVGIKDSETEIWGITDQEPFDCRVNDIISEDMGYKYCY